MKPEEFSPLRMYGRREIFQRRLDEGYTEVALGGGDWVGSSRIVGLWAFYNPEGNVSTYEHPKFDDLGGPTRRGAPFEATYTSKEFESYCKEKAIKMREPQNLAKILQKWEE